jgi:hypothetical protein
VYPRNLAPLHYQIASEMQLAATVNMQRVILIILKIWIPYVLLIINTKCTKPFNKKCDLRSSGILYSVK